MTNDDKIPQAPAALMRVEGADATNLDSRYRYAKAIAGGGDLVPKALWSPVRRNDGTMGPPEPSAGKVMVVTEVARMLGFHPLAGLMGVHVIEGKPSMSAAIMSAKVRNDGHRLRIAVRGTVEAGDLTAIAILVREDDPDWEYRVEWTLQDAMRAGLGTLTRNGGEYQWAATKDNWRKYPRAMLKARAIAEVIREGAEDSLMGAAYIPDELGADTNEDGEVVGPAKPSRDWAADIAGLRTIDAAAVLREELRNSDDYTPELWGALLARVGAIDPNLIRTDPEPNEVVYDENGEEVEDAPAEPEPAPTEQRHEGTEDADPASAPAEDFPSPQTADFADADDPEWTGPACPACGLNHDVSVHDVEPEPDEPEQPAPRRGFDSSAMRGDRA